MSDWPHPPRSAAADPQPGAHDVPDAEIAARLQAGDDAAFEAAFDRYAVQLCAFALQFTNSREQAVDVVHDVFLRIWQHRERLDVRDNLRAYLYQATRNHALNYLRRKALEQRWTEEAVREQDGEASAPGKSAQQMLEEHELVAAVERIVAAFPERRRTTFLLRWRDGLHYEEIAERMGTSVKTVENQMNRALRTLRAELGSYFD